MVPSGIKFGSIFGPNKTAPNDILNKRTIIFQLKDYVKGRYYAIYLRIQDCFSPLIAGV